MKIGIALVAAMMVSGPLSAQPTAPAKPDPVKGQKIASQVCAACHGADGNATAPANPKLAGQIPEYTSKQLMNFKPAGEGKKPLRENAIMMGFASQLSPQDMHDVAAYYAQQKLIPDVARNKESIELGQRIWRAGIVDKGIAACAGCHGPAGQGIPSQYPHLAGQSSEYIEAQMKAWRSAERANDPNAMMRTVAARLTDREIKAVSDFIAGLR